MADPKTGYNVQHNPDGTSHHTIHQGDTRLSWNEDPDGAASGIHFGNNAGPTPYNNFDDLVNGALSNPFVWDPRR